MDALNSTFSFGRKRDELTWLDALNPQITIDHPLFVGGNRLLSKSFTPCIPVETPQKKKFYFFDFVFFLVIFRFCFYDL